MEKEKKGIIQRMLNWVEKVGNKLPHPVIIFIIMALIIIVVSEILTRMGVTSSYFDARENTERTIQAVSLMNADGLRYIFNTATKNFTNFAPLGTVLVTMLGVGVAEHSGLIGTALKKLMSKVPGSLLTAVVVFAGIISNIASDAGYVVVIPLGAIMFAGARRHPIAGLAAAFAGVSGGFSANIMFGPTDALLGGITNAALTSAGIDYSVNITANWYFLIVSTILLTIVGTIVTERIVEPHLGRFEGSYAEHQDEPITPLENQALKHGGWALLISAIVTFLMVNPWFGPMNEVDSEGVRTIQPFLNNGIIFLVLLLFAVPGYFYGRKAGTINDSNELIGTMTEAMKSMAGFIVLAFFAAQVIEYFSYSNIGILLATSGAEFLEAANFTGIPLILAFILLTAFINLFIGSASAKWAILAPIFIPMFFTIGLSPEMTQMAYRVADSSTNIISPLMNYFAMILVFMQRYDKKAGLGTLISVMIPFSMAFLIFWTILLIIWYYFQIPLGPDAPVLLSMMMGL